MAPRCAPPAEALQLADNLGRFGAIGWTASPALKIGPYATSRPDRLLMS